MTVIEERATTVKMKRGWPSGLLEIALLVGIIATGLGTVISALASLH